MENSKVEPDWATLAVTPGATAPAGMVSNLTDPESRAWHVEYTIGFTLAPAILLVGLRVYARLRLARSLGVDDCTSDLECASRVCVCRRLIPLCQDACLLATVSYPKCHWIRDFRSSGLLTQRSFTGNYHRVQ